MPRHAGFGACSRKKKASQLEKLEKARAARHGIEYEKENTPPHPAAASSGSRMDTTSDLRRKHDNKRRALKRAQSQNTLLKEALVTERTSHQEDLTRCNRRISELEASHRALSGKVEQLEGRIRDMFVDRKAFQKHRDALLKRVQRLKNAIEDGAKKGTYTLITGGAYSPEARALARHLFQAGCAPEAIGKLIQEFAATFGIVVSDEMSARTVRRCALEGLAAADVQIAHEIKGATALTISQDSTSNRNVNYQAHHIALRTPSYREGETEVNEDSRHSVRLLRVASTVDHSSKVAVDSWLTCLEGVKDVYNDSPLSQRTAGGSFYLREFFKKLKAMGAAWEENGLEQPILLANKFNAAKVRDALDPSRKGTPLSDDEAAAIEASTRGGVKATALAGTLFNNKDDKKGYGDAHLNHLYAEYGMKHHKRFPDTSNVRFNTYAEAAGELLKHLPFYVRFMERVHWGKQRPGWTNIEVNLHAALKDPGTLTEMSAMVVYSQSVTHPYIRAVRGHGTESTNVLDLGPLHKQVHDHCEKMIENPDLLIGKEATSKTGSLDGLEWEDEEAMSAVRKLIEEGKVPHLRTILIAFLKGALVTWVRFSAEFAPGGIIDGLSADEKELAWMPSTNDTNEGALGAYRVHMRDRPSTTLLNYNAQAVFRRNDTGAFMKATFEPEDHKHIRGVAREWDRSGVERKRVQELAKAEKDAAEAKKAKDEAAKQAEADRLARLAAIKLVSLEEISSLIVKQLDEQLDTLRDIYKMSSVKMKTKRGAKQEKADHLREVLTEYLTRVKGQSAGATTHPGTPTDQIVELWAQDGDELEQEMDVDA